MKKNRITIMMFICLGLLMQASMAMATVNDVDAQSGVTKDEKEIKRLNKDGTVPDKWNLPKPKAVPHPDVPPESASGSGDGQNSISFTTFSTGNPIVVLGTATGHAGEWDASKYNASNLNQKCIWSANTTPVDGVQLEAPSKYRGYDEAYGLWVYGATTTQRVAAKDYCAAQNGEPYSITSLKSNQSAWYCSKLVWASWKYTAANIDLDGDGGLYVWPVDLINDNDTMIHTYSN